MGRPERASMYATPARLRAATTSLVVGLSIFVAKLIASLITGSTAILADALESIVNVCAAAFALFAVRFAAQPADHDHPYGHGKMEQVSAAFEGGLVTFAAMAGIYAGVRAFYERRPLQQLDRGLALVIAAALANLALGTWLVRRGRALDSPLLVADGRHVLSDVYTTVGALIGLALVRFTKIWWIDPLVAIAVSLLLARIGTKLVLESAYALLDSADPQLIEQLTAALDASLVEGVRRLRPVRALRFGRDVHVDAVLVAPAEWSVARARDAASRIEATFREKSPFRCDLALQIEPPPQRLPGFPDTSPPI